MLSGPDVVYLETEKQDFIDWLVEGYQFRVKQVPDLTKVDPSSSRCPYTVRPRWRNTPGS